MLKSYRVGGGGGLQDFSISPSPLLVNLGFKLGWTGLGLGLGGLVFMSPDFRSSKTLQYCIWTYIQ